MRKYLIIRSVSFQLLDRQLPEIMKYFGENEEYHLLTHSHSINRAEKYEKFSEIIDYKSKGDFSSGKIPESLKNKEYDAIIIPLSNLSGAGFLNVFLFSLRIKSKSIFIINSQGKIKRLKKSKIITKAIFSLFNSVISLLLTLIFSPILLILLLIGFVNSLKKK